MMEIGNQKRWVCNETVYKNKLGCHAEIQCIPKR
jgi:hypothetical protein